jgi:excisionase family DNA binding protein
MKRNVDDGVRATFKIPEAALRAGCGPKMIRELVNKGLIPHFRFGRNILIPKAAFMRWLDSAGEDR